MHYDRSRIKLRFSESKHTYCLWFVFVIFFFLIWLNDIVWNPGSTCPIHSLTSKWWLFNLPTLLCCHTERNYWWSSYSFDEASLSNIVEMTIFKGEKQVFTLNYIWRFFKSIWTNIMLCLVMIYHSLSELRLKRTKHLVEDLYIYICISISLLTWTISYNLI